MIRFSLDNSGRFGGESFKVLNISALILALTCESTPLSSKVSLRTSLSSLIDAILNYMRLIKNIVHNK